MGGEEPGVLAAELGYSFSAKNQTSVFCERFSPHPRSGLTKMFWECFC